MPRPLSKPEPIALTPRYLVEALGEFDLDPCGEPYWDLANRTYVLARGEDGLQMPYFGRVWLHPPASKVAEFLGRLVQHGDGIALVYAKVETEWFHDLVWHEATGILFLKGRLKFLDGNQRQYPGNSGGASCLVAYGNANVRALAGQTTLFGQLVVGNKTITV